MSISLIASKYALAAGLLAVAALVAGPLRAEPEQPRYQVEVVVFAQPAGTSVERPPRQPELPEPEELPMELPVEPFEEPAMELDEIVSAEDEIEAAFAPGFEPASMPRALDRVAAAMNRGGYRLLWHQAWVQPALAGEPPSLDELATLDGAVIPSGLQGSVSLAAGRFLHLGMELEFHSDAGLEAELRQRRRIRLGVEQYFDDPAIGVIAVVSRLEEDVDQSAGEP